MAEKENKKEYFEEEEQVLKDALEICGNSLYKDNPLLQNMKVLSKKYKQLLRQEKKLIKLSDKFQHSLNKAKNDIENLNEISKQISISLDFDIVFNKIAEYYNQTYIFDICFLALLSGDKQSYRVEKYYTRDIYAGELEKIVGHSHPVSEEKGGLIARSILENSILSYKNKSMEELIRLPESRNNSEQAKGQCRFILILPIMLKDEIIGSFVLINYKQYVKHTADDIDGMIKFSNQIAIALKNSKLYGDAEAARLRSIEEHCRTLEELNKSYYRFVPFEFLAQLGKDDFSNVQLGEQIEKEMTVLFCDIRSFTSLSERMTPEENFNFLNSYLSKMGPVIRKHRGYIDKYMGDGFMALFPGDPDDALDAALNMQKALDEFNSLRLQKGYEIIRIGTGIHFGTLILGTIGEEERMEVTVISDAVNLTSRIEDLTKLYGASIIISEDVFVRLKDPNIYCYRFLGLVKVKGKTEPASLIEIFDNDPVSLKEKKLGTKDDFEIALFMYKKRDYREALEYLQKITELNPADKAAAFYYQRAAYLLENPLPRDWEELEENEDLDEIEQLY